MLEIEKIKIFSGKYYKYYFAAILIVALVAGIFVYFLVFEKPEQAPYPAPPKEKTMEEILQSLTAPASSETVDVPESVIKSLTAPPTKKTEVPESVIQSLTAPAKGQ